MKTKRIGLIIVSLTLVAATIWVAKPAVFEGAFMKMNFTTPSFTQKFFQIPKITPVKFARNQVNKAYENVMKKILAARYRPIMDLPVIGVPINRYSAPSQTGGHRATPQHPPTLPPASERVLKVKRVILDTAYQMDVAGINANRSGISRAVGAYQLCAQGGDVAIQSMSVQMDGRDSGFKASGILKDSNRQEKKLFNNLDVNGGRQIDVSSSNGGEPNVFTVRRDTCSEFRVDITNTPLPQNLQWYRVNFLRLHSDAPRVERFNIFEQGFVPWLDGETMIGSMALFTKTQNLWLTKWPNEAENAILPNTTGALGGFTMCARTNNQVNVRNFTLQVETSNGQPIEMYTVANMNFPERPSALLRDYQVQTMNSGTSLVFPANRNVEFESCANVEFGIVSAIPEGIQWMTVKLSTLDSNVQQLFDGARWDNTVIPLPFSTKFIVSTPPQSSQLSIQQYGMYANSNGACWEDPYLSFSRIDQHKPSIFFFGGNLSGLPVSNLTVNPEIALHGTFQSAELEISINGDPSNMQIIQVQPEHTYRINTLVINGGFGAEVRLRSYRGDPSSTIQLQVTNMHANQNIDTTYQRWNCSQNVQETIALPLSTVNIIVVNPEIYEVSRNSPARTQNYTTRQTDDILLFEACFESYPGPSQLLEYTFQHNSGKDASPFENVRLDINNHTNILASWDRTFAKFRVTGTDRDYIQTGGWACMRAYGSHPVTNIPFEMKMNLVDMKGVAYETDTPYLPVHIADDLRLSTNNFIPGIRIHIDP